MFVTGRSAAVLVRCLKCLLWYHDPTPAMNKYVSFTIIQLVIVMPILDVALVIGVLECAGTMNYFLIVRCYRSVMSWACGDRTIAVLMMLLVQWQWQHGHHFCLYAVCLCRASVTDTQRRGVSIIENNCIKNLLISGNGGWCWCCPHVIDPRDSQIQLKWYPFPKHISSNGRLWKVSFWIGILPQTSKDQHGGCFWRYAMLRLPDKMVIMTWEQHHLESIPHDMMIKKLSQSSRWVIPLVIWTHLFLCGCLASSVPADCNHEFDECSSWSSAVLIYLDFVYACWGKANQYAWYCAFKAMTRI